MTNPFATNILPQLDELIINFETLKRRSKYDDCSDINEDDANEFITAVLAAIYRVAGPNNQYSAQVEKALEKLNPYQISMAIPLAGGALKAMRHAVASGYVVNLQELIHASVFSDFLDMAAHLLGDGYKDPAAVLIGGVLEEHLRKLCDRSGVTPEVVDPRGVSKAKKADTINADLAKQGVYSKLDHKNVTAWLDLRNKAAHGYYEEYTAQQVDILLQSVRDFIVRHPA